MRGEHPCEADVWYDASGSSPHARGALVLMKGEYNCVGIIPACAGSTSTYQTTPSTCGDHPRMRGEHRSLGQSRGSVVGSSPHARGARHDPCQGADGHGIIPACAGSTARPRPRSPASGDHPRMRGEHRSQTAAIVNPLGSSPHARGAHHPPAPWRGARGIIPACAGSTQHISRTPTRLEDHPRMRGEHFSPS